MLSSGEKVVFIGVPVAGKDDAVIKRAIQVTKRWYLAKHEMSAKEVAFIDNFDVEEEPEDGVNVSLWYLGRSLKRLSIADEAIFGEGWHTARGCLLEVEACLHYGIPINVIYNCKEEELDVKEDETSDYLEEQAEIAEPLVNRIFIG